MPHATSKHAVDFGLPSMKPCESRTQLVPGPLRCPFAPSRPPAPPTAPAPVFSNEPTRQPPVSQRVWLMACLRDSTRVRKPVEVGSKTRSTGDSNLSLQWISNRRTSCVEACHAALITRSCEFSLAMLSVWFWFNACAGLDNIEQLTALRTSRHERMPLMMLLRKSGNERTQQTERQHTRETQVHGFGTDGMQRKTSADVMGANWSRSKRILTAQCKLTRSPASEPAAPIRAKPSQFEIPPVR